MLDVSNHKLFMKEKNLQLAFARRGIDINDVKVLTKPRKLTKNGFITFLLPPVQDKHPNQSYTEMTECLGRILGTTAVFVTESNSTNETISTNLTTLIIEGKAEHELREQLLTHLQTIRQHINNSNFTTIEQWPESVMTAFLFIKKHHSQIYCSNVAEETLLATFEKEDLILIEQLETIPTEDADSSLYQGKAKLSRSSLHSLRLISVTTDMAKNVNAPHVTIINVLQSQPDRDVTIVKSPISPNSRRVMIGFLTKTLTSLLHESAKMIVEPRDNTHSTLHSESQLRIK